MQCCEEDKIENLQSQSHSHRNDHQFIAKTGVSLPWEKKS